MRITINGILELRPCPDYTRERLQELFGRRKYATPARIVAAPIPAEDRLWLMIHMLPEKEQRLLACDCAERALKRERKAGREPGTRSWAAIEVGRRFARGEATLEELAAAWDAAWDAAQDAAWDAWDAWAAWAAALAAVRAAALAAEREWQIKRALYYAEVKP